MNTRRPLRLATCCLAGALALGAGADPQQSQSQQQQQPGGRSGEHGGMRPGGFGGFGRGFDPSSKEYQEFREQLKAFCLQHSPKRWQEFEDRVQRGGPRSFRGQMSAKFRELQALEKSDPALHAIKVRLIEVEDLEYGLVNDLKNVDRADEKRVADLRAQLREQDEKYVRLRFEERSHRIDRLARILEDEKRKLADDRKDTNRLVDDRLADLEKQGPDYFFRYPPRPDATPASTPTAPPGGPSTPAAPDK
jgi:hypothetical protein